MGNPIDELQEATRRYRMAVEQLKGKIGSASPAEFVRFQNEVVTPAREAVLKLLIHYDPQYCLDSSQYSSEPK